MHRHQNITTPNKLLVHVELRYGWPVRVFLDTCRPQALVSFAVTHLESMYLVLTPRLLIR